MRKLVCIFIGFILLLGSCIKEKFDSSKLAGFANLTPGLAVPIGYANMTLSKYLNDSFAGKMVVKGDYNAITLVYHSPIFSVSAADLISLPDFSTNFSFSQHNGLGRKSLSSLTQLSDTAYIIFEIRGATADIDSININSGSFNIQVDNPNNLNGSLKFTFPDIRNGTDSIRIASLGPTNLASLNLKNDLLRLGHHNGMANVLKVVLDFDLNSPDNYADGAPLLGINISTSNVKYSVIYGSIGNVSFPLNPGNFNLGFYEKLIGGNFYFLYPELELLFNNSIGFPVEFYFTDFHAGTRKLGNVFAAGAGVPGAANPKIINYPTIPFQSDSDIIELTRSNSNLPILLDALPTSIFFSAVDSINPGNTKGFITDSSKLEGDMQFELPLWGHTDSLLFVQDTLSVQFPADMYRDQKEIQFVYFILNARNGFPLDIIPQVYFADNNLHVVDSLFNDAGTMDKSVIHAAQVNGIGVVREVTENQIIVKFTPDRIQKILNTTRMITRGKMISSGATQKEVQFIKTPDNSPLYSLSFNLGVIVQLQINTGL